MKRINLQFALLTLCVALTFTTQAQRFDWVQSYSGAEPQDSSYPKNYIVGSTTDSKGNLYVAGQFAFSAVCDGQELMPFSPWGGDVYFPNACLLKFSPDGELLWKKVLHANQNRMSYIINMQLLGDTALWVCADFDLPRAEDEYLYFYDTLITPTNRNVLLDDDSICLGWSMAVTAFDLDGSRQENYILHLAYKDSVGDLIMNDRLTDRAVDSAYIINEVFRSGAFHVDNQGNIYLGHIAEDRLYLRCDTCSGSRLFDLQNGLISEVVVMVNGHTRFADSLTSHPTTSNYRIMKFSPHFDDLLACRYVFENEIGRWNIIENQQLITDTSASHLFLLFNVDEPTELADQSLTGSTDKVVQFTGMIQGVIVEYDSLLQPLEVYQVAQMQPVSGRVGWNSFFYKMVIDADSNLLFILGDIANVVSSIDLTVNGQQVGIGDSSDCNAFFLKTRIGSPTILADGYARSEQSTSLLTTKVPKGVVASKGRLFAMVDYSCNIQWHDTSITLPRNPFGGCNDGEGVFIWSYDGEELDFIDLKKCSYPNPVSSSLALHDSALYICGGLVDNILFADTLIRPSGNSIAYMARYVDPAFMMPYGFVDPRAEQIIEWDQELIFALSSSPVTLTAIATSGLPVSYICADTTIAQVIGNQLNLMAAGTTTVTASQQGDSDYLPAEPVTKTLQVNDVGTDALANSSPQIFPNPTSGMVTIDLAKTPPATPLPPKQPRRGDTSDINMVLYTSPGAPFSQTESANFPYHQRYNMKVNGSALQSHDGIVTAWLTDMQGRREEVVLTPTGPDRYTLDLTSRPPAAYLLTVTTVDGRELTFRLMKQYGRK